MFEADTRPGKMHMGYTGELKFMRPALWDMLRQESDYDHPMWTGEIIRGLQEKGIPCDR